MGHISFILSYVRLTVDPAMVKLLFSPRPPRIQFLVFGWVGLGGYMDRTVLAQCKSLKARIHTSDPFFPYISSIPSYICLAAQIQGKGQMGLTQSLERQN